MYVLFLIDSISSMKLFFPHQTHHRWIFNSSVLCFVFHISNLPLLAVRPTHVRLFESWRHWQCKQIVKSSSVRSLSTSRRRLPVQIINLRQQMSWRLSPLTSLPPSSLAWAHATWAYRLASGICWPTFNVVWPSLKGLLTKGKVQYLFMEAGLELIQIAISGLWGLVLIEKHG